MSTIKDYLDSWGLIVQKNKDGGDCAHKIGTFGVASFFAKKYQVDLSGITGWESTDDYKTDLDKAAFNNMSEFVVKNGIGVRHPDPYQWWSDPFHFSRDQQTPLVIAAGFNHNYGLVFDLFKKHLQRFFTYQNFALFQKDISGKTVPVKGDIASPEHIGYYFRAMNWFWMYPFLLLGDMFMLLNSLILVVQSLNGEDKGDFVSNNITHSLALLQAKERLPTPISWLARKVYSWFLRSVKDDNGKRMDGFSPQTMWDRYFRDEAGGPPMFKLSMIFLKKEL